MEYPFWHVGGIGATMLIPVVALLHVLVSHFAVGGGILLWLGIRKAYAENDRAFLGYLRRLTRFFVLLTVVFGAITGVGIWWTIGLSSPQTTSNLIHAFVFGWATEWVAFVIELASALGLYYLWEKFSRSTHIAVAFIYALAAWISLVLITGITAFMATSGKWPQTKLFWDGFLNPTFLPGVVARTGGALALSGLYIYMHASFVDMDLKLKEKVVRWVSPWSLLGVVLIGLGGLWWYAAVPPFIKEKVAAAPTVLILSVVAVLATLVVLLFVIFAFRAEWMVPPFAVLLFLMGATGLFAGEFLREGTRKPYTIERFLYSSNIYVDQVDQIREQGFINSSKWPKYYLKTRYPELFMDGQVDTTKLATLSPEQRLEIGETIFEYHCGVCHTRRGYNALLPRVRGVDPELLEAMIEALDDNPAMPPWTGKPWELKLLVEYLATAAKGGVR